MSNLFFADNSLIFYKSTKREYRTLKGILLEYEEESSQAVNFNKSGVLYSSNMNVDLRRDLSKILGVHMAFGQWVYLSLPSLVGKTREKYLGYCGIGFGR